MNTEKSIFSVRKITQSKSSVNSHNNTIFREENKPFEIERSLFWYYPYDAKVTKEESEAFIDAVEEYITYNKDLLKKV